MIPSKHSFSLLSRKDVKKIRLNLKLSKKKSQIYHLHREVAVIEKEDADKKRAFLRLAGLVSLGVATVTLIPKKASALVFGSSPAASHVGVKDSTNTPIDPVLKSQLPTDLTAGTEGNRYLKVSILGGAADGVAGANVGIKNSSEQRINPATNEALATLAQDESIILLRRIVKQLEASATVDKSNRQRVVLDGIGTGSTGLTTELSAVLPVSFTACGATGYQAGINNGQPVSGATPYTINSAASSWYVQVAEGPVDQRWRVAEDSHVSYQVGIRSHVAWS